MSNKPNKANKAHANANANANANAVDVAPASAPTSGAEPSDAVAPSEFEANPPALTVRVTRAASQQAAASAAGKARPASGALVVTADALVQASRTDAAPNNRLAHAGRVVRLACQRSGLPFEAGTVLDANALQAAALADSLDWGYVSPVRGSYVRGSKKNVGKAKANVICVLAIAP